MERQIDERYFLDSEEVKAIEQWYGDFYGPLCKYANRMIKNIEDVHDIVMEAMTKLCERPSGFNSEQDLRKYLYSVTRLACEHFNMEAKRFKRFQSQYSGSAVMHEEQLLNSLINKNHLEIIYNAAQSLPERYYQIFTLYYKYELKNSVIARYLGKRSNNIGAQKNQVVVLLKDQIVARKEKQLFKYFRKV